MSEPVTTVGSITIGKYILTTYIIPALSILVGATANALMEIKKNGWHGWTLFFADLFIAMVSGNIIYQFALIVFPVYAILGASLGGYMGPNSVRFLIRVIKTYK